MDVAILFQRLAYRRKLVEHPGNALFKRLVKMRSSYMIYYNNYYDWRRRCQILNAADNKKRFDDPWRWRQQREITRCYHNLLASFQAYLEHMICHNVKSIDGVYHDFKNEAVNRFKEKPLTNFIKVLRDLTIHKQVYPLVSKGQLFTRTDGKAEFVYYQSIDRTELEKYLQNGRNGLVAFEFLKEQPKSINVEILVNDFFSAINALHHRLVTTLINQHSKTLADFITELEQYFGEFGEDNIPLDRSQLRYLKYVYNMALKHR